MPSLASGHRHRCDLTIDIRRLYRSRHCAGPSYMSRRASCAHGAQCPSLASGRRRRCALAVHIGRLHYRSRHRAGQSVKSRRHCAGPSYMSRRASCAHGAQCPSLASGRRRRCALAVHIGRLHYRSRHRAGQSVKSRRAVCAHGRSVKSRRARCALMVLDALFGIRPPPSLSSRRPHRTFVPLLPSCRAIVQVEMRSLCAHRSRCPLWRRTAAPSLCSRRPHWTFVYRSRHRARRPSSRDALNVLTVLDALFCVGPAVAELSPSTSRTFIPLLSSYRAILQVETRSSCSHGSRCPFWRLTAAAAVLSPVHIGRFYRSRHRAGRMFKSRRALIAFTGLDALLWRQAAAAAVLSPSTSDVCTALAIMQGDRSSRDALEALMVLDALFGVGPSRRCALAVQNMFIPLSPSCRAIIQVETRSYCVRGAQCPSFASGRRRCCALAVHTGRLYRSRHHARRSFKSRRARSAHGSRCPLWRRTAAALCSCRPHRTFVPLLPLSKA